MVKSKGWQKKDTDRFALLFAFYPALEVALSCLSVLASAEIELIFFTVAGTSLCSGFRIIIIWATHWWF